MRAVNDSARKSALPQAFEARMQRLLGEDYAAFAAAYASPATRALYLPDAREDPSASAAYRLLREPFALQALDYVAGGYLFDAEKVGNHPLHHAGAFYVQDPSAMATVAAAPLAHGMRVLDLCAAPGGKSVQLASCIGKEGFLLSNEINPSRCRTLCGNIERMGFPNVLVANADPKRIAGWYTGFFDLVLVDAPCSGEGMFRKYEGAAGEWSENAVTACAARQADILQQAAKTVRQGGWLLYSTCTFSEEENEQTVRRVLEENPRFALRTLPEALQKVTARGIGMPEAARFYPHLAAGEGQFMALLQEVGEQAEAGIGFPDARTFPDQTETAAAQAFLEDVMPAPTDGVSLCRLGARLAICDFEVPKENVFAAGVTLGTVEKRRLIPHHQFFKAFGNFFYRRIALKADDVRVRQYLSGAEIDVSDLNLPDGWAAVTVCGYPLGGAKIVRGTAKNHYPKGLRLL